MQNTNYLQFNMTANSPQEDRPDSHSKRTHSPHNLTGKSTIGRARSSSLSLCCLSLARRYVIDSSLCCSDVGLASTQPLTFLCSPMALIYKTLVRCPRANTRVLVHPHHNAREHVSLRWRAEQPKLWLFLSRVNIFVLRQNTPLLNLTFCSAKDLARKQNLP